MIRRMHLWVSGRVQGVFFRASARDQAEHLGLTGWVRNVPGGRVEIVAEGDDEDLEKLRRWARRGPAYAYVTELEETMEPATGEFKEFDVRY